MICKHIFFSLDRNVCAVLENKKDFYQPVVSIMEAEMALNETRSWSEISTSDSSDFRDVIPGIVSKLTVFWK